MSTTHVGIVVDGLVATWTTAGVTVIDGPAIQAANIGTDVVYVGWDGGAGADAARGTQDWASLGNRARDENLSVTCYVEANRGDTTMKPTRDAALAVVTTCEQSLRSDPQLDGALSGPSWAAFAEVVSLTQLQTSDGSRVGVVFTVNAFARL